MKRDEDRFTIATDEEVMEIEDKARSRTVLHWPELVRLINRLRKAEDTIERLTSESLYIVGFNDGFDEAVDQNA